MFYFYKNLVNTVLLISVCFLYATVISLTAIIAAFSLSQTWLFLSNQVFQAKNFDAFLLAAHGFLPFVIFLLLLFNSLTDHFNLSANKIHYSKYY
jgi:hypothetical protein